MTIDAAILSPVRATASVGEHDIGRSNFLRQAARQPGLLVASLFAGFAVGVAYRFLFDPPVERDLVDFRSQRATGRGSRLGRPRGADGVCVGRALPIGLGAATTAASGRTRRPSGRYGRRGDRG